METLSDVEVFTETESETPFDAELLLNADEEPELVGATDVWHRWDVSVAQDDSVWAELTVDYIEDFSNPLGYNITIGGTGAMMDYEDVSKTPWYDITNGSSTTIAVRVEAYVTHIGANSFAGLPVKSVSFYTSMYMGVVSIGEGAFKNCTVLENAWLGNTTIIEKEAFAGCTGLQTVDLDQVRSIGDGAFQDCTSLKDINKGNYITDIAAGAFYTDIQNSLAVIDRENASEVLLHYDWATDNRYVPYIIYLYGDAYSFISEKQRIYTNPDGNATLSSEYIWFVYEGVDAHGYEIIGERLTSYELTGVSEDRHYFGAKVFFGYSTDISAAGDGSVMANYYKSVNLLEIQGSGAIKDYPDATSAQRAIGYYYNEIKEVIIYDGVTSIGSYTFYDWDSLEIVTIADSVTAINDHAFYDCGALKTINLPNKLTTIGESAFRSCGMWWNDGYELPASLTTIGSGAFYNCRSIDDISIPGSVTVIGDFAFAESGMDRVRLGEGIKEIGRDAFNDCAFDDITLPESLEKIGEGGFRNCYRLKEINGGDNVKEVGANVLTYEKELPIVLNTASEALKNYDWPSNKRYLSWRITLKSYDGTEDIGVVYARDGIVELPKDYTWYISPNGTTLVPAGELEHATESKIYYGDYEGFTILGTDEEPVYTGSKLTLSNLRVYHKRKLLTEGVDYTLAYGNNVNAYELGEDDPGYNAKKAPYVNIKMKGVYTGTYTAHFSIRAAYIDDGGTALKLSYPYTGKKAYKPIPAVTWNGVTLKKGKDYDLHYSTYGVGDDLYTKTGFTEEGDYQIEAVGIGNFFGSKVAATVQIYDADESKDVSKLKITLEKKSVPFTGEDITFGITVKDGTETLEENTHYSVRWLDNKAVGTAKLTITGNPEYGYVGSRTENFKITGTPITKAKFLDENDKAWKPAVLVYSGIPMTQDFRLVYKNGEEDQELIQGEEYSVSYENNLNAGTAKMTVTGNPDYGFTGSVKKTFKIKGRDLSSEDIEVAGEGGITVSYLKGGAQPNPDLTFTTDQGERLTLREYVDYKVTYINNKAVADEETAKKVPAMTIQGIGNYTGTIQVKFSIEKVDMKEAVYVSAPDKVWKKAKNNFKQTIKVYDASGQALAMGEKKDYSVTWHYTDKNGEIGEEIPAGEILENGAQVTVKITPTAAGGYTGDAITQSYRLLDAQSVKDIAKAKMKIADKEYTGNEIILYTSDITASWKDGSQIRKMDSDETIGYRIMAYGYNVRQGNAVVLIKGTGGEGGYSGLRVMKFKIKLAKKSVKL